MSYRAILNSNSKLLALYFVGTFITLLFISIIQQGWYKFSESDFFEKYFVEKHYEEVDLTTEEIEAQISQEEVVEKNPGNKDIPNEFEFTSGDTLRTILENTKISSKDITKITNAFLTVYNPKKLKVGNAVQVEFVEKNTGEHKQIKKLTIRASNAQEIIITMKSNGEYEAKIESIPLIRHIARLSGEINNSFIATASKMSLPHHIIMAMVKAYSYDVDFQRDMKQGNKIDILVDKYYTKDGKFSHYGNVLYSNLILSDRNVEIFQFGDKDEGFSYYNSSAISVKKEFLMTPINAARISSGFGMRKHPVLGYSRMHKGVDFAAPIGTPILAAGNGVIVFVGRKGGYGKYIKIKHNDTYSTAYAHMSKFARDVRNGLKVKQGQVIGYVGVTGITSGPHLHFEVLNMDRQINPKSLKAAPVIRLKGKQLLKFNTQKREILALLKKILPQTEIIS